MHTIQIAMRPHISKSTRTVDGFGKRIRNGFGKCISIPRWKKPISDGCLNKKKSKGPYKSNPTTLPPINIAPPIAIVDAHVA